MRSISPSPDLPVHSLKDGHADIQLKEIAHDNPYDFTQKHRHSYFEILFFEKGGGRQLIDFHQYTVKDNSCYIVFPKQIHLLKRASGSHGQLIQFKETSLSDPELTMLLYDRLWRGQDGILFEKNEELLEECRPYLHTFGGQEQVGKIHRMKTKRFLLQSMLYDLLSMQEDRTPSRPTDRGLFHFLKLIDQHHRREHTVRFYVDQMTMNEKKLGTLTKRYLGLSPLQVIHSRLVIEAKLLLVFADVPQKEIAWELGFDNPARFSAFIKNRTGSTPSELKLHLAGIHK